MPTNDPTAPRVVGGGAKCNCGFHGGTLADHAEYCPASPHYRAPKPFAEAFPAVLPEEGTPPPSCGYCGTTNPTGHKFGCRDALKPLATPVLPGEEATPTVNKAERNCARCGFPEREHAIGYSRSRCTFISGAEWEANALAAPSSVRDSGGAPTEERDAEYADECLSWAELLRDTTRSASLSERERQIIARTLEVVAHRLTRSPRAAGEPTREELIAALADIVVKAIPRGQQDGDFVLTYTLPTGPIHRAIPLLSRLGIEVRPGFDGRLAPCAACESPHLAGDEGEDIGNAAGDCRHFEEPAATLPPPLP